MADRRRYTGTQRLQLALTLVWIVVTVGLWLLAPLAVDRTVLLGAGAGVWLVGLVAIAVGDLLQWRAMVAASGFQRDRGPRPADLERLYESRSVSASTTVPTLLAQTHLELTTRVDDVDAEFGVTLTYVGSGGTGQGVETGIAALDEAFVVEGRDSNVARILSPEVSEALLAVETPGTCRITGTEVRYDVPFTRLSGSELDAIAETLVAIADRVEAVAGGG